MWACVRVCFVLFFGWLVGIVAIPPLPGLLHEGSVWDCTEHPGLVPVPRPPWGRKNCKAKPRSFPQKWLNLHTLQVKQATNRHKTAKNLMKNMIQCRIKTDRDSGLKTPSDAMRRVPGGSPDQKHPTWKRGVFPAIPNRPKIPFEHS